MEGKELGFVHSMFNVPIVHYPIQNWSENKKKILDALPAEDESQKAPNDNGLYTDYFTTIAAAGNDTLPDYFNTVLGVIEPYLNNFMDGNRVEFTEMWYQKYYKNIEHKTHCHGSTGWSSVIYVEFDTIEHASTMFHSPFRQPWDGNIDTFSPNVNEGDMVLFPSSLLHEAPLNKSDKRRTIISYNIRGHVDFVKHTLFGSMGKN